MNKEDIIYKKLTEKEKKIIENIEEKANKRPHKVEYTPDWIVSYMLESFKDFSYDEKEDALDMLNAIFEIAEKCKCMTKKEIIKERKYMVKEYVNTEFEDEDYEEDE